MVGVDFIYGVAAFDNSRRVVVNQKPILGTQRLKIVIATGCYSKKLIVPGAEWGMTCEELFSSNQELCDTIIIGAGRK